MTGTGGENLDPTDFSNTEGTGEARGPSDGYADLAEQLDQAPPVLCSLEQTAQACRVSIPTVRAWIQRGCPVVERGQNGVAYQLDLRAVFAWRQAQIEQAQRDDDAAAAQRQQLALEFLGADSLTKDRGPATLSQAERAAAMRAEYDWIKIAELRGELIRAQEFILACVVAARTATERIRALPDRLQPQLGLTDDQAQQALDAIDEVLEDLADELGETDPRVASAMIEAQGATSH